MRFSVRVQDLLSILLELLKTEIDCGAGGERCLLSNKTQMAMQGKVTTKMSAGIWKMFQVNSSENHQNICIVEKSCLRFVNGLIFQ